MKIETAKTDSLEMDYFRFGRGKKPLVIIPGLAIQSVMASANDIATAYQVLADDFTIYVLDRRKDLPPAYSVRDMARDVREVLRLLRLEQVCVFGASLGGMVALTLAIENPRLVSKLAVGSSAARVTDERFQSIEEWVRLAESGDALGLYLAFAQMVYPQSVVEQSSELLAEAAKTVTDKDLGQFAIRARGLQGFDVLDSLEAITCPLLVIGSTDDGVIGGDASLQIAERLKGRSDFELHMYEGFGHAAYDLAPDYKERLLRFFIA